MQKEAIYGENAHLKSGVTKIIFKTELGFLLSPTSTVRSRVDSKQAISHNIRFIFMLQHVLCVCFRCDQRAPGNSLPTTILKKGEKKRHKKRLEMSAGVYLFSGKTSLSNLNLNKVTVERDLLNQFLAFYFLTEATGVVELPQGCYHLQWD